MRQVLITLLLIGFPLTALGSPPPPPNTWVAWQSNREDGRNELYLSKADGSGLRRLTQSGAQRPSFAPDGRWISFQGIDGDVGKTFVIRPDGSGKKLACAGTPRFWMHDNTGLVCQAGSADYRLVDPDTDASSLLFRQQDFGAIGSHMFQPNGITHDGRYLVAGTDLYRPGFSGTNGTFTASFAAVILDLQHRDRVYFFGDGCWPFTPPAGNRVYHVCGNCPTKPDIYRMDLTDLATRASYAPEKAHPDADWGHEYNPDISNDNRWVAYMASTGCHSGYECNYDIFLHELGSSVTDRFRVTEDPRFDGYPTVHVGELWQGGATPQLVVVPSRLVLTVDKGAAVSRTIEVRNAAGGDLAPLAASFSLADAGLAVGIEGSGNQQRLTLSFAPVDLGPGEHQLVLTIIAANARNAALELPIVLRVEGCGDASTCPPTGDGSPKAGDSSLVGGDGGASSGDSATASGGDGCALGGATSGSDGIAGWLAIGLFVLGVARWRRRRCARHRGTFPF